MSEAVLGTKPIPALDNISIARLHGQACIDCGAVTLKLSPAGRVLYRGRLWTVVACADHIARHSGAVENPTEAPRDLPRRRTSHFCHQLHEEERAR
jgi:hypothetical protein